MSDKAPKKTDKKRVKWTPEEDGMLKKAVEQVCVSVCVCACVSNFSEA
jgi:hypothetical protein